MSGDKNSIAATVLKLADLVSYQSGAVVSRVVLKQKGGNVTVFAFGCWARTQRTHCAVRCNGERHRGRGRDYDLGCAEPSRFR